MSVQATHWAWQQRLTVGEKLVLLKLADTANPNYECYPSHATVSRDTGLSRSHVRRCITKFIDSGLVRTEQRWRENGSQTSNSYILAVEEGGAHSFEEGGAHSGDPAPLFQANEHPRTKPQAQALPFLPDTALVRTARPAPKNTGYTAADAVAHFVDQNELRGLVFASSVKGQVARAAKGLVDDGIDRVLIEQAIDAMIDKGLNPSSLPSLIGTVQVRRTQTGAELMEICRRQEREEAEHGRAW